MKKNKVSSPISKRLAKEAAKNGAKKLPNTKPAKAQPVLRSVTASSALNKKRRAAAMKGWNTRRENLARDSSSSGENPSAA